MMFKHLKVRRPNGRSVVAACGVAVAATSFVLIAPTAANAADNCNTNSDGGKLCVTATVSGTTVNVDVEGTNLSTSRVGTSISDSGGYKSTDFTNTTGSGPYSYSHTYSFTAQASGNGSVTISKSAQSSDFQSITTKYDYSVVSAPPKDVFKNVSWVMADANGSATNITYPQYLLGSDKAPTCGHTIQNDVYKYTTDDQKKTVDRLIAAGVLNQGDDSSVFVSATFTKQAACKSDSPTPKPSPTTSSPSSLKPSTTSSTSKSSSSHTGSKSSSSSSTSYYTTPRNNSHPPSANADTGQLGLPYILIGLLTVGGASLLAMVRIRRPRRLFGQRS